MTLYQLKLPREGELFRTFREKTKLGLIHAPRPHPSEWSQSSTTVRSRKSRSMPLSEESEEEDVVEDLRGEISRLYANVERLNREVDAPMPIGDTEAIEELDRAREEFAAMEKIVKTRESLASELERYKMDAERLRATIAAERLRARKRRVRANGGRLD
jgi:hypothetical protein